VAFLLAFAVQYGLYHRLLRDALHTRDLLQVRPALTRWIKVAIVWQVLVLVACGVYLVAFGPGHRQSAAWISPAVGAVFGTAIPLQLVVMAILRSMRA
jgi:hypothetical protein